MTDNEFNERYGALKESIQQQIEMLPPEAAKETIKRFLENIAEIFISLPVEELTRRFSDMFFNDNRPDGEAKPEEKKNVKSIRAKNHVSPKARLPRAIFGCDEKFNPEEFFDIDFIRVKSDLKGKFFVAANLRFEDLPERLQKKFADRFTRAIHDTACSLILAGNKWIWGQQVIAAMGGYERGRQPTEALIRQVEDELDYMAHTWCRIDATNEAKARGYKFKEITFNRPLIPTAGIWEFVHVNGRRVKALQVVAEPVLLTYAKQKKQVITIPDMSILAMPDGMSMTRESIILQRYLLEQIETMKHDKDFKRVMLYETIYKNLDMQEASRVEKKRIRDNVKKFLSDWQDKAYIKGFEEEKDGQLIRAVRIILFEDEPEPKALVKK